VLIVKTDGERILSKWRESVAAAGMTSCVARLNEYIPSKKLENCME